MTHTRINNLIILHVYTEHADALSKIIRASEFVGEYDNRRKMFGKF